MEYANIIDVSSYMGIQDNIRLRLVLDGVNADIENMTAATITNSSLKLAACIWTEYIYKKTAGVKSETDIDVQATYDSSAIPKEVMGILQRYISSKETKPISTGVDVIC